jgi:hypothetical protein
VKGEVRVFGFHGHLHLASFNRAAEGVVASLKVTVKEILLPSTLPGGLLVSSFRITAASFPTMVLKEAPNREQVAF